MEGVILFADDHIHTEGGSEKLLFEALNKDLPVLGVNSLDLAKQSIQSIGSFSALILDWQFSNEVEDDFADIAEELGGKAAIMPTTSVKEDATLKFLEENDFYSLIYIYSETDVEEKHSSLKDRFGDRIKFKKKTNISNTDKEKEQILKDLKGWEEKNQNLSIPIKWNKAINQKVQKIFHELSAADPNWVRDLYKTADEDGVEPSIEVINLFQSLLSEKIIQDTDLKNEIKTIATDEKNKEVTDPKSYAQLFRRFFYANVFDEDPIMTGDIFDFGEDEFGILITPECDIRHIVDSDKYSFEFLTFTKNSFRKTAFNLKMDFKLKQLHAKIQEAMGLDQGLPKGQKQAISLEINNQLADQEFKLQLQAFTQTNSKLHVLPSFKFGEDYQPVMIDFRLNRISMKGNEVNPESRVCKLNSPYIQDLRQRYLSYIGRVGVPSLPDPIRRLNLGLDS
jgi:hypothetical protein